MAKTEVGDCREGKGAVQGSPPSAPWVQHPSHRSLSPGSAWLPTTQPRAALSLFLGTQGGFLLPRASPCAWRSGVTRAGASRGQPSRRDFSTHKNFFLCQGAGKAAPSARSQLGSSITPTAVGQLPLAPSLALLRVSSLGCQFFHSCLLGSEGPRMRPGSSGRGGGGSSAQ